MYEVGRIFNKSHQFFCFVELVLFETFPFIGTGNCKDQKFKPARKKSSERKPMSEPVKMLFPDLEHENGKGKKEDIRNRLPGKDPPKIVIQNDRPVE